MLSMHAEAIYAARAVQAGARGYISKGASSEELVTAVIRVSEGKRYVERDIATEIAVKQFSGDGDVLERLTTREMEILRLLGEGKSLQTSPRRWASPTRRSQTPAVYEDEARRRAHRGPHPHGDGDEKELRSETPRRFGKGPTKLRKCIPWWRRIRPRLVSHCHASRRVALKCRSSWLSRHPPHLSNLSRTDYVKMLPAGR